MTTLFDPTLHFFFNASSCLFSKLALFVFPPLTNGRPQPYCTFEDSGRWLIGAFSVLQAHPVTHFQCVHWTPGAYGILSSLTDWGLRNPFHYNTFTVFVSI